MIIPPRELRSWIESNFLRDRLEEFVQDESVFLALDEHCTQGGSSGEVEVSELHFEIDPNGKVIRGSFHVLFSESYFNGCREIEWSQQNSGSMSYEIAVATGELTVTDSDIIRMPEDDGEDKDASEEPGNRERDDWIERA